MKYRGDGHLYMDFPGLTNRVYFFFDTVHLLKNIRNLIEITNSRIQWKTEELFPVGNMVKQVDDLLLSDQAK